MLYYLKALFFTALVECGLAALQSRDLSWVKHVFFINVLTNPAVNLLYRGLYPLLSGHWPTVVLLFLETLVVVVEGLLIYRLRRSGGFKVKPLSLKNAFLYAFIINLASYCFGMLITPILRG